MSSKFDSTIQEAAARVISRASNSRGLAIEDIVPRITQTLGKYLFKDGVNVGATEVRRFIDELRADELCLVLACEKGDADAWRDLVRDFDSTVRSTARKMCTNSADADDLASSIWAELHGLRKDDGGKLRSKLSYYSGRGSLGGWLRAIVSQLAIDEFRKQSRMVQVEEDRELDNLAETVSSRSAQSLVSPSDNPEDELMRKRRADDVMSAIRESISMIGPDDRLMLKLYYFDDVRLKDIAATFGFHEATASRRLVKIQSAVRQHVGHILKRQRGWTETEVEGILSETAADLGMGIEQMLKVMIIATMAQELLARIVL